jgi:hypothetical protein
MKNTVARCCFSITGQRHILTGMKIFTNEVLFLRTVHSNPQEMFHLLWHPKVRYYSTPNLRIPSQINKKNISFKHFVTISHLPMRATCPVQYIYFYFVTLTAQHTVNSTNYKAPHNVTFNTTVVVPCPWGVTMSLNCSHQRVYCSSPM